MSQALGTEREDRLKKPSCEETSEASDVHQSKVGVLSLTRSERVARSNKESLSFEDFLSTTSY